ncbi:sensor histidine kinase [Pedobacter miscanthi]|jgi:two-component system LytT family sensor kinase|uniref:sensor histidine kinase n=1 Tax=Pedobacter miscanthi TaxID=2259170 RepID=UPI00292D2ED1|nr:histidine kinase [Pedobacter miscanthi]
MNTTIDEKNKFRKILSWILDKKLHILIWTIFIFYEAIIIGIFVGKFSPISNYIIFYSFNVATFYFHAHVVLAAALKRLKGRWWKLPLFILLELAGYLVLIVALDYFVINYTNYNGPFKIEFTASFFAGPIYRAIYFMCFSTSYYFLLNFLEERKKIEDLEKLRLNNIIQIAKSENAFLKAQIQPHLLFNTLDFIYQNARDSSPVAAEAILSLSEMMRYSVDSNKDREFILLAEEINQVENLINLHQLRNDHHIQLRFWYDDEIRNLQIIPMVLITLVENIFKHGELLTIADPAEVSIKQEEDYLIIETANLTKPVIDKSGFGAGMENIKKRLDYTYRENALFNYSKDADHYFRVILKIRLTAAKI